MKKIEIAMEDWKKKIKMAHLFALKIVCLYLRPNPELIEINDKAHWVQDQVRRCQSGRALKHMFNFEVNGNSHRLQAKHILTFFAGKRP